MLLHYLLNRATKISTLRRFAFVNICSLMVVAASSAPVMARSDREQCSRSRALHLQRARRQIYASALTLALLLGRESTQCYVMAAMVVRQQTARYGWSGAQIAALMLESQPMRHLLVVLPRLVQLSTI
jgi:hypothetical protein